MAQRYLKNRPIWSHWSRHKIKNRIKFHQRSFFNLNIELAFVSVLGIWSLLQPTYYLYQFEDIKIPNQSKFWSFCRVLNRKEQYKVDFNIFLEANEIGPIIIGSIKASQFPAKLSNTLIRNSTSIRLAGFLFLNIFIEHHTRYALLYAMTNLRTLIVNSFKQWLIFTRWL